MANPPGMSAKRKFMILDGAKRSKRDLPERGDDRWIDDLDLLTKENGAVGDLLRARAAIGAGWLVWITEDGIGDENPFAR